DWKSELFGHLGQDLHDLTKMNKTNLKNLVNPVKAYVERSTLLSFLDDCIAHGDETAVAHWRGLRTARWSYARLAAAAFQFARELEENKIGAGDRVLFWGEN